MASWSEALVRILFDSSLRALFLAAGVGATLTVFRVRSGSVRHAAWTAALCVMLLMPALTSVMPAIEIPRRIPLLPVPPIFRNELLEFPLPASPAAQVVLTPSVEAVTESSREVPVLAARPLWPIVALVLYGTVAGMLCLRLVAGWMAMRRIVRRCPRAALAESSVILESTLVASPVTLGTFSPRIVLPAAWRSWPRLKRRAVLTHEIAHIRRRDPLVRLLTQLYCCIFWFSPLSWWMKCHLSAVSEHACDEATLQAIGQPQRYAEILLEVSEAVRSHGGRLAMQGLGVHGNGMMAGRIDRILRFSHNAKVTMSRKAMVAGTAALFVILAVACRQRASASIEEETQALKQYTAERVQLQDTIRQWQDSSDTVSDAGHMTQEEVSQLESRVAQHPEENVVGRKRLLYYYWWKIRFSNLQEDRKSTIAPRRRHILWLIQHRPDDLFSGTSPMFIPSDASVVSYNVSDPAGHEEAKKLWLAQSEKSDINLQVLYNAAFFLASEEKPIAEQLLLRAHAALGNDKSTEALARLYAMTLAGISGFTDFPFLSGDAPRTIPHRVGSPPMAARDTPFAQEVRRKLSVSVDDVLLNKVGEYLTQLSWPSDTELRAIGTTLMQRAVQVNPTSKEAIQVLADVRSGQRRQRLYRLPTGDQRYPAVAALPDRDRFELLWALAVDRFYYGQSFDVSQRDDTLREWNKSRRYAEDLVRLAPKFSSDPEYGAALLNGNLMLAFVAAENGEHKLAVKYLRDAANAPASQGMDVIAAPWQRLCLTLIQNGEKDAVLDFLDHIAPGYPVERTQILAAAAQIRRGQKPDAILWRTSI